MITVLHERELQKAPRYHRCWSALICCGYFNFSTASVPDPLLPRTKARKKDIPVIVAIPNHQRQTSANITMKSFLALALFCCCAFPFVIGTRFVCYFPNWTFYRPDAGNFKVSNIDPFLCTDLVYSFAVLDGSTYEIKIFDSWVDIDNKGYADFVALKSRNPQLKTTIAIGGWTDSHDGTTKYSDLVASPTNRAIFVQSVVKFLQDYQFDGLDLDWEYPSGESDKAGFADLMRELRNAFGTKYLLTVAVAANSTIIDKGYDVPAMAQTADYINLMAYDMHGAWEPQTDHHAPLYKRDWETVDNNIDYIVKYWIDKGLSADKINMGIPLYGKSWTLGTSVEPDFQALGAGEGAAGPFTGLAGTLGYNEICKYVKTDGWQSVDDPDQLNGPYAVSASNPKTWVSYDDTKMAGVKSQYVLDNQLGGAMVWDISTDDFHDRCGDGANPLMTTISQTVISNGSRFICYFPNWGYYRTGDGQYVVDNINASLCTDLVYAFAVLDEKTYKIVEYDPDVDLGTQQFYAKFVDLKKQNPNLKTTIAIGGWTDSHDGSDKYSKMVASSTNRATFVTSVMEFLTKYKFDGLDIDWEYPSGPSDKEGLAELMKELRAEFGFRYLLTVAVAANLTIIDQGYNVPVMAETADYINVMAYDMHGPWELLTDHHAPLYQRDWDTDLTNNVHSVINYWIAEGLPASKIMMGIPLYGKSWTLNYTYTEDATLPAPGLGPGAPGPLTKDSSGYLGYYEICNSVKNEGWEVVVDEEFKIGPYASSPNVPKTWVGYDDPAMANVKSRYVLDNGLGGAMVWDISTDDFRNTCGEGVNPIMTNISRTVGVGVSSTTTFKPSVTSTTTATSTSVLTSTSSSGETSTAAAPKSTTKLSTWPRTTTAWTTRMTIFNTPFSPSSGDQITSHGNPFMLLIFVVLLMRMLNRL